MSDIAPGQPPSAPRGSFEAKQAMDEAKRAQMGEGPGELVATMGIRMDWGDAMSKLKLWASRYRKLGALHVYQQYDKVQETAFGDAVRELHFAGDYAWDEAQQNVPVDTGYLQSTGSLTYLQGSQLETDQSTGQGLALVVARYTATYAALVHEEPEEKRVSGHRKWLESAFMTGHTELLSGLRYALARAQGLLRQPILVSYDSVHGTLKIVHGTTPSGSSFLVGRDPKGRFRSLKGATPNYL